MKKIAIAGASGFVAGHLKDLFSSLGYEIVSLKRSDYSDSSALSEKIQGCEIVVNLAGANIVARWTDEYKKTLYHSRIDTTNALVEAFGKLEVKPKLFISTSAVGIYTPHIENDEDNYEYANDFLSNICQHWEKAAHKAEEFNIRTVIFRFGVVMGENGGALSKMLPAFKLGIAGTIGDGSQPFPFVHFEDLKRAFKFAVENKELKGVYNLAAPVSTTNKGLTKVLGKTLNRPTFLPLPEFVLRVIFSEGAKILTDGQIANPKRLQEAGFEFKYKTIEETIENLLG
ncbi:MAG: TIGR01777 family oxidoreductase [Campylobacterota bacterium]|nr:TIGR01777 family oxidoreductase [Campylobacterota bacterium]